MTTSTGSARGRDRTGSTAGRADRPGGAPTPHDDTLGGRFAAFLERIDTPLTTYHMLVAGTAALLAIGLVMVLSASATRSYSLFVRQAEFAAIGVVLAALASRTRPALWKRIAVPGFLLALVLQGLVLVPGLGVTFQGNRNWIRVAGVQLQPSEFAKIALIVFGAFILERKRALLGQVLHVTIPFVFPAALLLLGLQLYGNDLGTGLVLIAIVAGMLYAVGLALRWFAVAAGVAGFAILVMTMTSSNRTGRISAWLGDACATKPDLCRQVDNGFYALAGGGWWGTGLGQSKQKWGWLPESSNDFILAVIGEELGLAGTLAVLGLYALIAVACFRLVLRSHDLFVRLAAAGVMVWIMTQAFINIGAVTGLLPVIGVPLPLISGGGTALISTLMALGMLMAFARHEPGAQAALAARPSIRPRKVARMSSAPRRTR